MCANSALQLLIHSSLSHINGHHTAAFTAARTALAVPTSSPLLHTLALSACCKTLPAATELAVVSADVAAQILNAAVEATSTLGDKIHQLSTLHQYTAVSGQ